MKDFPHLNKLQFRITEKRITEQQVRCVPSMNISPAMQISSVQCARDQVHKTRGFCRWLIVISSMRASVMLRCLSDLCLKKKKKKCNVDAYCDVDTFKLTGLCQCRRMTDRGRRRSATYIYLSKHSTPVSAAAMASTESNTQTFRMVS